MNRATACLIMLAVCAPAHAQTDRSVPACATQQQLEQVVNSKGQYTPDDCRKLTITPIVSGGSRLCVLDFETGADAGFLDRLRTAAVPTKWWVVCDQLQPR